MLCMHYMASEISSPKFLPIKAKKLTYIAWTIQTHQQNNITHLEESFCRSTRWCDIGAQLLIYRNDFGNNKTVYCNLSLFKVSSPSDQLKGNTLMPENLFWNILFVTVFRPQITSKFVQQSLQHKKGKRQTVLTVMSDFLSTLIPNMEIRFICHKSLPEYTDSLIKPEIRLACNFCTINHCEKYQLWSLSIFVFFILF